MKIKQNLPYYIVLALTFILLKYVYTQTETSDLKLLLEPTSKAVEFLTGRTYFFTSTQGYFFEELNVTINKSCSGFNFFTLSFVLLSTLTISYLKNNNQKVFSIILSLFGAYFLSILANSSRIYSSIILQEKIQLLTSLDASIIHESIGIINNLTFLIVAYYFTEKLLIKLHPNEILASS
jgi:exosortase K